MELPANEHTRLEALLRFKILDTEKEEFYNSIIDLVVAIMGVPFASIAFVDASRLWFKASHGFADTEVPREYTFCSHAVLCSDKPLIVKNATLDERFADNPYVLGEPGVRFYYGEPLVTNDNKVIGVLCGTDTCARVEVTAEQIKSMRALSKLVMTQLELREFLTNVHEGLQELSKSFVTEQTTQPTQSPSIITSYQELNVKCDNILDKIKERRAKK